MTDCPSLPRSLTLDAVVEHVVLPSGRRCFPVEEEGRLYGLLTLHNIRDVPRERWTTTRVQDVMIPLERVKTARLDEELSTIMERMAEENINQLPVMSDGHLEGIVARDNLLRFLQLHGGSAGTNAAP
jgi:CBS domain-containing protein